MTRTDEPFAHSKTLKNISPSHPTLSIVSPIHCEEHGIAPFLNKLEEVLVPLHLTYEIILVDDGSSDNSWQRMQEESRNRNSLRCLRLSRNFGKEAALVAGLEAAQGLAVITLDSDLQHPPRCIPEMVHIWQQGKADLVEAQKSQRQKESFISGMFAKSFYSLFALVAPFNLKDASDFKLMDRKVLNAWKQLPERRVFFRGMSSWLGFRQEKVFFEPDDRTTGVSQWSFGAKMALAFDSLSAYSTRLLFFVWGLSFTFALFAFGVGGETLWMKFNDLAMSGFTTVILLILISTTAILASLCILSLYVRQIFYEVKQRPLYFISESATSLQHYIPDNKEQRLVLPKLTPRKSKKTSLHRKKRHSVYVYKRHCVSEHATTYGNSAYYQKDAHAVPTCS